MTAIHIPQPIFILICVGLALFWALSIFLAAFCGAYRAEKAMTEERVSAKMERKYGSVLADNRNLEAERKRLILANGEYHETISQIRKILG